VEQRSHLISMVLESVFVAIFQLDLNRHFMKRDGAESRRGDILHRLLSSHGSNTCSHALTMQLLEVELLDDIVAMPSTSHFLPDSFANANPCCPWPRKTQSGKPEPFNFPELINPMRPTFRRTSSYPLWIFQALSTSSSHVNLESGLRRFGQFWVPRC
jgi:hypothetical protein